MSKLFSQLPDSSKTGKPLAGNVFALSHPGNLLDHNEDFLYISADGQILVLADGMGGHRGGETAARLGVESAQALLQQRLPDAKSGNQRIRRILKDAMLAAYWAIVKAAAANPELSGMGAVMIMAVMCAGRLYTCHVGDARAYLWRQGQLQQITQDHSLVAELVKLGRVQPEEMRNHPLRNQVLQALGQREEPNPELHYRKLNSGDQILLCSDGLWESLSESAMAQVLAGNENAEHKTRQLLQQALENLGQDNISLILCQYDEKPH